MAGKQKPYCCPSCFHQHVQQKESEVESETTMADKDETSKTTRKVLPTDFIKRHNDTSTPIQAEMNFERLRGIW